MKPTDPAIWPDRIIELWASLAVKKPKLVEYMEVEHIGYSTIQRPRANQSLID